MIKGIWEDAGGRGALHILAGVPKGELELNGERIFAVACMSQDSPGIAMLTRDQAQDIIDALTVALEIY